MKLKNAIEIAKDCGLDTIGEAIMNIKIHVMSIFEYGKEAEEYKELEDEYIEKEFNIIDLNKWLDKHELNDEYFDDLVDTIGGIERNDLLSYMKNIS